MDPDAAQQLFTNAFDSLRAGATAESIERELKGRGLTQEDRGVLRQALVVALCASRADVDRLLAAADSAMPYLAENPISSMSMHASVATTLVDRDEQLEAARAHAEACIAVASDKWAMYPYAMEARRDLGMIEYLVGAYDSAAVHLGRLADADKENGRLNYEAGLACERAGKSEEAAEHYLRATTVFVGSVPEAEPLLRRAYARLHDRATIDRLVAERRAQSRSDIAFRSYEFEKPAPALALTDTRGRVVDLAKQKGRVVLVTFWGTWCGECLPDLPDIDAIYRRYERKDVTLLAVAYEGKRASAKDAEHVKRFMRQHNYSFPVSVDLDGTAIAQFDVHGFPQTFAIDRKGMIRFRIPGRKPGFFRKPVEAQLDSLLVEGAGDGS